MHRSSYAVSVLSLLLVLCGHLFLLVGRVYGQVSPDDLLIMMHRYPCEGPCPDDELVIQGTGEGKIVAREQSNRTNPKLSGSHQFHVRLDSLMYLVGRFEQIRFFDLPDSYPEFNEDFPKVEIFIHYHGRDKRVYLPEWSRSGLEKLSDTIEVQQMKDINALAKNIDAAAGTERFLLLR